jgi:hypothetical protein
MLPDSNISHRKLQSNYWHPLRIFIDYSRANSFIKENSALNARYRQAIRQMEGVRKYFESYLQVNFYEQVNFNGGTCYNTRIPAFTKKIDLYVVISPENDSSTDYFAAATSCYTSLVDGRPTLGAYILNFAFMRDGALYDYLYFSTFAHEFTHLLGFSSNLYSKFKEPGTGRTRSLSETVGSFSIGSETFFFIILPEIAAIAKAYYNCPNLPGLPLENNGDAGSSSSHWEKLFLPTEYMNPAVENPAIISQFTLKLLEASGWYKVNYDAAQYYDWGKGAGCSYFGICPVAPSGFCSVAMAGNIMCSHTWTSIGNCYRDPTFTSGCPYLSSRRQTCLLLDQANNVPDSTSKQFYGPGSRCFNFRSTTVSTSTTAGCYRAECANDRINVFVGSGMITCLSSESRSLKSIPGFTFPLECPDFQDFCQEYSQRCPSDCNGRGYCLAGNKCFCFTGWGGSDCSQSANIDYGSITGGFSSRAFAFPTALLALVATTLVFHLD